MILVKFEDIKDLSEEANDLILTIGHMILNIEKEGLSQRHKYISISPTQYMEREEFFKLFRAIRGFE